MTRNQVVYHLGAHKTGSSLLQRWLRDHPDDLGRHRIVYLSRSEMNERVGWGKKLLKRPEILEQRLAELLSDPRWDAVLTSHENTLGPPIKPGGAHLYPRGPEIAQRLAGVLRRWPSRILIYVRPQHEFVESYYLQHIQQGHSQPFGEWLDQFDLEALSWRPVVDALRRHFGPEHVDVVDFGLIRRGQDAFLADFLRRVDPALEVPAGYRAVHNASISEKGLRVALTVNPHLRADWQRKAVRTFLQRRYSNRAQPRPVLFTPAQKAQIRQRYELEYTRLAGARPLQPRDVGSRA